jgi:hypothetical protein
MSLQARSPQSRPSSQEVHRSPALSVTNFATSACEPFGKVCFRNLVRSLAELMAGTDTASSAWAPKAGTLLRPPGYLMFLLKPRMSTSAPELTRLPRPFCGTRPHFVSGFAGT